MEASTKFLGLAGALLASLIVGCESLWLGTVMGVGSLIAAYYIFGPPSRG